MHLLFVLLFKAAAGALGPMLEQITKHHDVLLLLLLHGRGRVFPGQYYGK